MTTTISLPRLAGTREAFTGLLDSYGLPQDLSDEVVTVLGRDLVSGSASYADELVKELLVDRGAAGVQLVGSPRDFADRVLAAASHRGVEHRITIGTPLEAPA